VADELLEVEDIEARARRRADLAGPRRITLLGGELALGMFDEHGSSS
jgi:hypothetical protein